MFYTHIQFNKELLYLYVRRFTWSVYVWPQFQIICKIQRCSIRSKQQQRQRRWWRITWERTLHWCSWEKKNYAISMKYGSKVTLDHLLCNVMLNKLCYTIMFTYKLKCRFNMQLYINKRYINVKINKMYQPSVGKRY